TPIETADSSRLIAILQRSLEEALAPYQRLELQILVISTIALLIATVASVLLARGISRPLFVLAQEAEKIARGDYSASLVTRQNDEVGQLARSFNEMRSAIAEREEQIRYQATHDELTGLPNRTLFLDRLDRAIATARRDGSIVGMIMMDLDRFKEINDTLGHHFGDKVLIEVGRRLMLTLRESDTVARLGGDEFAVTFFAMNESRSEEVAHRIREVLEIPLELGDVTIEIEASMGIALYPLHAGDAANLMKRADVAMYDAKKHHLDFAIYEPGRDEHSLRRLAILSELRNAVASDELELFFQPKIDVSTRRAVHAEALVRWRHPEHGVLSPAEFVPLAEQSGNIGIITRWVLENAIRHCGVWNEEGIDLSVAVNLSALDLFDADLPSLIHTTLGRVGLPPSKLVLEITESAVMRDPIQAMKILGEMKSHGVTIAIDDYGTGYSSLSHLKQLPADELKIDKSFVLTLESAESEDGVIVRSTIDLGHSMGLKVIAEGVETAESWNVLETLGCDMAQGYFISRPLPASEFREWMGESEWGTIRSEMTN
ncbi:MAG: EAL domain-containing protein, partial [Thermoanaerobaculia bacterium]|nr:EAL domain-containing protein [Thermoanaerobaculia bacterium]